MMVSSSLAFSALLLAAGTRAQLTLTAGESSFDDGPASRPFCGEVSRSDATTGLRLGWHPIIELWTNGTECDNTAAGNCQDHDMGGFASNPQYYFVAPFAPAYTTGATPPSLNTLNQGGSASWSGSACTPPGVSLQICPTLNFTLHGANSDLTFTEAGINWNVEKDTYVLRTSVKDWLFGGLATGIRLKFSFAVRNAPVERIAEDVPGRDFRFVQGNDAEAVRISFPDKVVVNSVLVNPINPVSYVQGLSGQEYIFSLDVPLTVQSQEAVAFVGFKILSEEETADADSGAVDVGPSLLVALLFGTVAVAHP